VIQRFRLHYQLHAGDICERWVPLQLGKLVPSPLVAFQARKKRSRRNGISQTRRPQISQMTRDIEAEFQTENTGIELDARRSA
jgi:hypothetical protein